MNKENKKVLMSVVLSILIGIIFINNISAGEPGENIGTYKQNSCITLPQICSSCTYAKITSIIYPNQTILSEELNMTKTGTFFNYTFCDTNLVGEYKVTGRFDVNGVDDVFNYIFEVTPDGSFSLSKGEIVKLILILISFIFALGLSIYGVFNDKKILLFASIPYFIVGLSISTFSLILDKFLLDSVSILNTGLGFLCLAFGIYEWLPNN